MKILLRSLLVLLLLAAALLLAVSTELGSQRLLKVLEQVFPIEVDYGSGSLSGRLYLNALRVETDSVQMELTHLVAEIDPVCLFRSTICLREFQAKDWDIALLENSEPALQSSPDLNEQNTAELITFPVALELERLDIAALHVHWSGGDWQQGSMQGQADTCMFLGDWHHHRANIVATKNDRRQHCRPRAHSVATC